MIEDGRLETHIPYIGDRRVPYWCFGECKLHEPRCSCCFCYQACEDKRLDLIEWSPIVARVYKDLL